LSLSPSPAFLPCGMHPPPPAGCVVVGGGAAVVVVVGGGGGGVVVVVGAGAAVWVVVVAATVADVATGWGVVIFLCTALCLARCLLWCFMVRLWGFTCLVTAAALWAVVWLAGVDDPQPTNTRTVLASAHK